MESTRAGKFLLTGLLVVMIGCSDRLGPTEPSATDVPGLTSQTEAASQYVSISGPTVIYSSSSSRYTFTVTSNLIEPDYTWYQRYCDTLDVYSCASAWHWAGVASVGTGVHHSQSFSLASDCSLGGTRSFQVKVDAKGWYAPTLSATHVTQLCSGEAID